MGQTLTWVLVVIGIGILGLIIYLLTSDRPKDTESEPGSPNFLENKPSGKELVNYNTYYMGGKEKLLYTALAAAAIFAVGFIFYRSLVLSAVITPLALLYPRIRTKEIIKRRKEELNLQFKEALYSLSSSLSAGKSIETAFKDAHKDLVILYPDPDTFILKELQYISRRIEMNETVESALQDFARRSHLEDVRNFVDIFQTCKRTGGDLVQVMKNTSDIINDKITIKQEIATMLSQRKIEQKVLNLLPLGMILILSTSAEDFMRPVFTQPAGRMVMTVSVLLLTAAYFLSKKIMDIEV